MANRSSATPTLRRVFTAAQWAQVCVSIPLCFHLVHPLVNLLGAGVVLVIWLLNKYGKGAKSARVIGRVLVGISLFLAALFAADAITTLAYKEPLDMVGVSMVAIAGPLLPYLSLAAGLHAVRGRWYDRFVACFCYTWLLGVSLLYHLTAVRPYIQPNAYLADATAFWWVWSAVLALTAVLCYIRASWRTPDDTAKQA